MQRGNGAVIGKQNTPTTSVATGVWALNEVQRAVLGGNWPASTIVDPYFENVSLLLHGNGTNGAQNNTFLDSSTNNFTITRNGNTTQGTFTPYGANWSNYFDGTGDYLSIADNAALEIGASSFSIEAWIYLDALPSSGTSQVILSKWVSGNYSYIFQVNNNSGTMRFSFSYSTDGSSGTDLFQNASITAGTWHHVAITRNSTTVRFFLNGVQQGSTQTANATFYNGTAAVEVGRNGDNASLFKGYISNCRLVVGSAVYTADFTPSTAPLTAITNTSLLTCQSNRFIDNSSNNFTITRNGDVSVQRFSPFAPTTPYAAGTIGGSGYFDGSGDYLTTTYNTTAFDWWTTGTDFTIEAWVYPLNLTSLDSGTGTTLCGNMDQAGTDYWSFGPRNNRVVRFKYFNGGGVTVDSTATINANQWNHIAMTKTSSGITLFVNGVGNTATAISGTPQSSTGTPFTVGSNFGTAINAYVSGLRIVKGTAVYSGTTYTVPTAPVTAITNTSLLLSNTNGGIIDNAMMNDLETVGNAQISTSVSKFGGGSIYLDGTGDWLLMRTSPNLDLGTGDFTAEGWFYLTATVAVDYRMILSDATNGNNYISIRGGGTGGQIEVNVNGTSFRFNLNNSVSINTWFHLAVVRSGNTWYGFINGTSLGSTTNSGAFNIGNGGMYVGRFGGATAYEWPGYIDDLRITKGYARYTANFTAPTLPFPDQ